MYEKRSTRDENLREGARKANLNIDSFEFIDETLKKLPEEEAEHLDQLIADLIQIIIQDTRSIKNAIIFEYHVRLYYESVEKEIIEKYRNYEEYDEIMRALSAKYLMPEEVIDAIINNG